MQQLSELLSLVENQTPEKAMTQLAQRFQGQIVFSTSLGLEDQVISHMIFTSAIPVRVFTLDTGRLFPESYHVIQRTNNRYDTRIQTYFPESPAVEKLLNEKGPYSFYESVENRKECCRIRKVEPLRRALAGMKCWITGIRAEQSDNRGGMQAVEWDEANQVYKFHPLLNWSFEQVKEYIKASHIPYNKLHDQGFVSIGCAPCTRAIQPGEDFRAGRWWWEDTSKKECGLHVHEPNQEKS